jgi:Protein of unknown function (DUF2752)
VSEDVRSRRALAALVVSSLVLVELIAARALFRADASRVWFLGEPFGLSCGFNQHFHLPCPACGFTRGLVLAVHGQLAAAWAVFPAAPLLLFGLLGLVLFLFRFVARELYGSRKPRAMRWLHHGGLAYIALVTVVWAVGYAARLSEALASRS